MSERPVRSAAGVLFALVVVLGTGGLAVGSAADAGAAASDASCGAGLAAADPASDRQESAGAVEAPTLASYPDPPELDVARGDVAAIPVDIVEGDTSTVTIASTSGDYEVTLRVTDNDADDEVVLYVNTYLAGNETAVRDLAYTVSSGDGVAVTNRKTVSGAPLGTGAYDVTIETQGGTTGKTMTIDDPSVGALTVARAPGAAFPGLGNDSAVRAARDDGTITDLAAGTDPPAAANGDTLVYRLNVSGVFGVLAAQERSSVERNFLAVEGADAGSDVFDFGVTSDAPCPAELRLEESVQSDALRVAVDPERGALYVVLDTGAAPVAGTDGDAENLTGPGRASYTVWNGTHIADADETRSVEYDLRRRVVEFDPEERLLRRASADSQVLSGTATLAPGTTLTLELEQVSGDDRKRVTATVADDGTFSVSADLSDLATDSRYWVYADSAVRERALLVTDDANATAIWFDDQRPGETAAAVTADLAALEDGGFLAVYAVPPNETVQPGNRIGRSDYVEAGLTESVRVEFAEPVTDSQHVVVVAHRDDDGDERFDYPTTDGPYREEGDIVYETGRVLLAGDESTPSGSLQYLRLLLPQSTSAGTVTPTPTPTPTPPPTTTPATTVPPTPTARDGETTTAPGTGTTTGPGTGATTTATATPQTTTAPGGAGGDGGGGDGGLPLSENALLVFIGGLVLVGLVVAAIWARSGGGGAAAEAGKDDEGDSPADAEEPGEDVGEGPPDLPGEGAGDAFDDSEESSGP